MFAPGFSHRPTVRCAPLSVCRLLATAVLKTKRGSRGGEGKEWRELKPPESQTKRLNNRRDPSIGCSIRSFHLALLFRQIWRPPSRGAPSARKSVQCSTPLPSPHTPRPLPLPAAPGAPAAHVATASHSITVMPGPVRGLHSMLSIARANDGGGERQTALPDPPSATPSFSHCAPPTLQPTPAITAARGTAAAPGAAGSVSGITIFKR